MKPREKAPSLLRHTLGFLRLLLVIPETHTAPLAAALEESAAE